MNITLASLDYRLARVEALIRISDMLKISPFPIVSGRTKDAQRVVDWICERYKISHEEFFCKNRMEHLTWPRQLAAYVMIRALHMTTIETARATSRTHANASNAMKKAQDRIDTCPKAAKEAAEAMEHFSHA